MFIDRGAVIDFDEWDRLLAERDQRPLMTIE